MVAVGVSRLGIMSSTCFPLNPVASPLEISSRCRKPRCFFGSFARYGGYDTVELNLNFVGREARLQDGRLKNTRIFIVSAEKKKSGGFSLGDQLLDYIEGGPKLRKWYGAPDQLPRDGAAKMDRNVQEPEEEEEDEVRNENKLRDVVLVTDADSETGQLVILELILRKVRVRGLVKRRTAVDFGTYFEPVEGDVNDKATLRRVLRGVRAIICLGKVGGIAVRELVKGVEHVVLLSKLIVDRNQRGVGSLVGGINKRDTEENEAAVSSMGVPFTIVRTGAIKDGQGGLLGFKYGQGGNLQGTISREDAAFVCVEALDSPPLSAFIFEVVNGNDEVDDWSSVFTSLQETSSGS